MSNDIPRAPSNSEPLPTELLRMEHQLLADGAAWERRVPPTGSFIQRMRLALQEDTMRDGETPIEQSGDETRPRSLGLSEERGRRASGRWRALAVSVAAVLIVALLGAVFATLAQNHKRPSAAGSGPSQQTPTSMPLGLPNQIGTQKHIALGPLRAQPSATNQPGTPIVAQSDPKVMYEYADNGPGPVLRRSDDGGKSWHDLPFPQSSNGLGAVYLAVSPLDALNIFLGIDVSIPAGGSCVVHADMRTNNAPSSDNTLCPLLYRSQDGGSIWRPVSLPISGSIFPTGVVFYYDSTTVQGQGNRLYARVYSKQTFTNPDLDIRILSTTDDGATWQPADTSLTKVAPHVCEYAATPAGSTLFAVSAASCISGGGGILWRSDDAGVSWTQAGSAPSWVLPGGGPALVAANANGDPNRTLLYAQQMPSPVTAASDIAVSKDGGKTWLNAPLAGVPANAQPQMLGTAALPDGSIVAAFGGVPASSGQPSSATPTATPSIYGAQGGIACYYWSPGASAWKPLTPAIINLPSDLSNVFVSYTSAGLVVTYSIGDISTSDPLYTIQPFA
jgi:hypothetical protein